MRRKSAPASAVNRNNRDAWSAFKCPHLSCSRAPLENSASAPWQRHANMARHARSAALHKDVCGESCGHCYELWGHSAAQQHAWEQVKGLDLALPDAVRRTPTPPPASGARTPASTPRSRRSNSVQSDVDDENALRSISFASINSSAAMKRLRSSSSDFEKKKSARKRQKELDDAAENEQLVDAIKETIKEMPQNSAIRPQLIASMAEKAHLSEEKIAMKLGVSRRAVYAALQSDDRSAVQMNRQRSASAASRKEQSALDDAVEIWYKYSRRTQKRDENGVQLDIFYYDVTVDEMFECYRVNMIEKYMSNIGDFDSLTVACGEKCDNEQIFFENLCKSGKAVKRAKFASLRPKNVKKGEIRECTCGTCNEGYQRRQEMEQRRVELHEQCGALDKHEIDDCKRCKSDKMMKEMIRKDAEFTLHVERAREQRHFFKKIIGGELGRGDAAILFDFSPYCEAYKQKRTMDEGMTSIQCLHIVLFIGQHGEKAQVQYFDYFGEDSNDYHFFRNAMLDFFQREDVKKLAVQYFFSDGGPKHFKIRRSIGFALVELPILFSWPHRPRWSFFEANHGKSHCDSRAAVVKYFLKRLAVRGVASVGASGISNNINNNNTQKLTQRNARAFEAFDRTKEYDWKKFDSIRKWHYLEWTGARKGEAYVLRCLETSTDVDTIVEQLIQPEYKIESLAATEKRKTETITTKAKRKQKNEKIKKAKTAAAHKVLGIVDDEHTQICTDVRKYTQGKRVAVMFDELWYVGTILKPFSKKIGRFAPKPGMPKEEMFIKCIKVEFDDPFEHAGETVQERVIELQKKNFDFVDDVRLVKK